MVPAPTRIPSSLVAAGLVAFVLLATANAAGYRYGVSDQAFYIPAILDDIQPALYPQDSPLIESQARLMVLDEVLAGVVRATGASLQSLFLAGYLVSLVLIYAALHAIGTAVYASGWMTAALVAAFTMRHRIPRTSANSFEPYFHPRMLAFAVGALAIAAVVRGPEGRRHDQGPRHEERLRHHLAALALVGVSMLIHPTTGLFFGVVVGGALVVADRRLRPWLAAGGAAAAAAAAWALAAGPLRDRLVVMDARWLEALASKDSVFPGGWPFWAWAANLAFYGLWCLAYLARRRAGRATPADAGLLAGGGALVALFLLTLPLVEAGVAFFVQLQLSRVFWPVGFLATVYALGALELIPTPPRPRLVRAAAIVLLALSTVRGVYILTIEHPERPLFQVDVPASPWLGAMEWLSRQPAEVEVLADPGHAWKYGTSVRVTAARDVFIEEVKDAAVAMYSRDVALRVVERTRAVGDFTRLTADAARALDARYGLDFLVTTAGLDLPVAYRSEPFTVYSLK